MSPATIRRDYITWLRVIMSGVPAVICPACSKAIPAADVNVDEGVAFCRACGELSRLADIADENTPAPAEVLASPTPAGCRIEDDGLTLRFIASARSPSAVAGVLFAALFWNGIVSIFVLIVGTSLWARLVGPVPSWFPSPFGANSGSAMPLGMALFMVLFLTPFIAIGAFLLGTLLVVLFGRIAVSVRGGDGVVFTGVGPLGRHRKFDALHVRSVRVIEKRGEDSHTKYLQIETDEKLNFGSLLTEPRRRWMAGMLQGVLVSSASLPGVPARRATLTGRAIPPVAGPPLPEESS